MEGISRLYAYDVSLHLFIIIYHMTFHLALVTLLIFCYHSLDTNNTIWHINPIINYITQIQFFFKDKQ